MEQKSKSKQSLTGTLLFLIVFSAPVAPCIVALRAYRDDGRLRALTGEVGSREVPFGSVGREVLAGAGHIGRMMPARDRARAEACATGAAHLSLVRLRLAIGLWVAGGLSLAAAIALGFARRSLASWEELSWSSPLAAWAGKRGLLLSLWILLVGPLLFVMAPVQWAMAILVVMFGVASASAHVFVRNLPARL